MCCMGREGGRYGSGIGACGAYSLRELYEWALREEGVRYPFDCLL